MLKNILIFSIIALILVICFFVWQTKAYKTAEPKYQVTKNDGAIEIREYPPIIVAQVQLKGERYTAINQGFKILADYIFGNNTTEEKIAMTAPVIQQGTTISMTAPVIQQKNNDAWEIRFVMPADFTLKTLPKPVNKSITLLEIPAKRYAVIRFAGSNTQENLDKHQAILIQYLSNNHLKQKGEAIYAFYNPPWILPFLRRNEIMIEIN